MEKKNHGRRGRQEVRRMKRGLCGADCSACPWDDTCGGCGETDGKPFGVPCGVAQHCKNGTLEQEKAAILAAVRGLNLPDMGEVTDLFALRGVFINLEYPLPGGGRAKFWDDDKIYLGAQVAKGTGERCYGIAADGDYLLVSEYGPNGVDPVVVAFLRRREVEQ